MSVEFYFADLSELGFIRIDHVDLQRSKSIEMWVRMESNIDLGMFRNKFLFETGVRTNILHVLGEI